jgi:hypothetical protein
MLEAAVARRAGQGRGCGGCSSPPPVSVYVGAASIPLPMPLQHCPALPKGCMLQNPLQHLSALPPCRPEKPLCAVLRPPHPHPHPHPPTQPHHPTPPCPLCAQAGARICKALGDEFLPYLEVVMPPLLHSARLQPDVTVGEAESDDEEGEGGDGEVGSLPVILWLVNGRGCGVAAKWGWNVHLCVGIGRALRCPGSATQERLVPPEHHPCNNKNSTRLASQVT